MRYRTNLDMKEEKLKAVCNLCVIAFVSGLILMCLIHSTTMNIISFSLMAIACWIGMICGSMLDRLQRSRRSKQRRMVEIREQDEKDIRSGRYLYVLEKDKEPVRIKRTN